MKIKPKKLYAKLYTSSLLVLILLLIALSFHMFLGKADSFLLINSYHQPFFDIFFKYYTNFGDGLIWLFLLIGALIFKKKRTPIVISNCVISTLLAQGLKRLMFSDALRPSYLLNQGFPIHFVEGVKVHTNNSFPSGHTVTAFAVAFTIILMLNKKSNLGFIIILGAFLVGFSRVYLAQHFLIDVIAGAFLGVCSTYASIYLLSLFKKSQSSISVDESLEAKSEFSLERNV